MVGQSIKKYRKQKRMSQAELGSALNLSQGAISQWENGGSKPDINMIKLMAEIFGVSVLDLTGDVDTPALVPAQEKAPGTIDEQIMRELEGADVELVREVLNFIRFRKQGGK